MFLLSYNKTYTSNGFHNLMWLVVYDASMMQWRRLCFASLIAVAILSNVTNDLPFAHVQRASQHKPKVVYFHAALLFTATFIKLFE